MHHGGSLWRSHTGLQGQAGSGRAETGEGLDQRLSRPWPLPAIKHHCQAAGSLPPGPHTALPGRAGRVPAPHLPLQAPSPRRVTSERVPKRTQAVGGWRGCARHPQVVLVNLLHCRLLQPGHKVANKQAAIWCGLKRGISWCLWRSTAALLAPAPVGFCIGLQPGTSMLLEACHERQHYSHTVHSFPPAFHRCRLPIIDGCRS